MSTVAFLVNGAASSPMGYRARAFADRLRDQYQVHVLYRSPRRFLAALVESRRAQTAKQCMPHSAIPRGIKRPRVMALWSSMWPLTNCCEGSRQGLIRRHSP